MVRSVLSAAWCVATRAAAVIGAAVLNKATPWWMD